MPVISTLGAMSSRGFGEFAQKTAANYIEDVFSTYLYSGSSSDVTINNSIDLLTKGGMVWVKNRTNASGSSAYSGTEGSNMLFDTARGMTLSGFSRVLRSNGTNAQSNLGTGGIGANTNGFTAGYNGFMDINLSGNTYVSWTFRKQPKFFDVVTYTGDGVSGRTVSHNLGSTPGFIITKRTDAATNWLCYHTSLGFGAGTYTDTNYIVLNSSSASNGFGTAGVIVSANSTTFSPGASANFNGGTYVAYLFANNAGGFGADGSQNVISCGTFTTNASALASVTLGYEPQYIICKKSNGLSNWFIFDTMRGMAQSGNQALYAETSGAEVNYGTDGIIPTATGFNCSGIASNSDFIYIAIRRGPMRTPTSGTSVFSPNFATTSAPWFKPGFPNDLGVVQYRGGGSSTWFADRLRGLAYLESANTNAEVSSAAQSFAYQNGWHTNTTADTTFISWNFGRAPGFFDIVCYTGTGTARTVSHNLGVAPELMIVKSRTLTSNWCVYSASLGATNALNLNNSNQYYFDFTWNSTSPTASVFSIGGSGLGVNNSGQTYVAYLFASCPGVSKIGSYTGTGATQTINCGFTGGARYVLIKRTDSTGDWWVWDTARGMVAGTDPRIPYNTTAAETNANWVYTTTGGFQIVTSDATVNASGGTYIYLAIA